MAETWPGLDHEFRGTVTIAGLPADLAVIPPDPSGPSDPDRFQKRLDWEAWASRIMVYRSAILDLCAQHPEFIAIERARCAIDPLYLLAVYGYLYEPRKRKGRGGYIPWIPFARQAQMIRWYQWTRQQEDENGDGVCSKTRDMGASWTMCFCFVWEWIFSPTFNGICVSWKEEYVDSRMPRALFWKMDQVIKYLPSFLRPQGYDPARHRIRLLFQNPENGNTITGESTTGKSARGDRGTSALIDESAQVPGLMGIWTGMADVTDHRYAVSTEHMDEGDDFYNLGHGIDMEYRPRLLTMDWWENPLHDDQWYEKQVRRYAADPDGFEREIMRNPLTQSQFVYPNAREKMPVENLRYIPGNPLYITVDPGFDDAFACAVIQYNVADACYDVLGGYTNNKEEAAFYGPMITGSWYRMENGVPIDLRTEFSYSAHDEEFVLWLAELTNGGKELPKYIGDTYGDNRQGASADSWYSVWRRNHGVRVNADRLPSGKLAAHRMQARTHVGRRKAMRWIMPKLRFGDSIGARQVLIAIQNNQFPKPGRTGKIAESGMLRDKTTHYTSAMEFWAVNIEMQDQLLKFNQERDRNMAEIESQSLPEGPRFGRGRLMEMEEIA